MSTKRNSYSLTFYWVFVVQCICWYYLTFLLDNFQSNISMSISLLSYWVLLGQQICYYQLTSLLDNFQSNKSASVSLLSYQVFLVQHNFYHQITLLLWAGRSRDRIPVGGEIFRTCPDRPWGPPSLLYNGYRVSPGGKEWPGRDTDPSLPSSAVVTKEQSYISIPLRAVRPVQSLSACTRVYFTLFYLTFLLGICSPTYLCRLTFLLDICSLTYLLVLMIG